MTSFTTVTSKTASAGELAKASKTTASRTKTSLKRAGTGVFINASLIVFAPHQRQKLN